MLYKITMQLKNLNLELIWKILENIPKKFFCNIREIGEITPYDTENGKRNFLAIALQHFVSLDFCDLKTIISVEFFALLTKIIVDKSG